MEIGSIFLLLAVLILAAFFVARPFIEERRILAISAQDQTRSSLLAERERLILALQELDFDHVLHKIPAEDYPTMRAELLQKAADVLRQLDSFQEAGAVPNDAESRIEAAVAARRADAAQSTRLNPETDDAIEELVAARKAARREKSSGFCAKCGKPVLHSDIFCSNCGQPLR
jgi:hypothetical protein